MWEAIAKALPELSAVALVIVVLGGLLFWLFYKYIPGLQKDFKESLREAHNTNERQATEFRLAVANLQTSFLDTLEKERRAHGDAMAAAVASNVALERSIDRLTTAILKGTK